MTPHLHPILVELKQRLTERYGDRLERLVLFGSQARGDAEPDSDIDVLVVLRDKTDPYEEVDRMLDIVDDLSLAHDVVLQCVYVSTDRLAKEMSPLLMNVRREGVAV